ncbi:MAG: hypothetical protein AMXMBFR46_28380 [Acidimicrobiia bacterium]
MSEAVDYPGLVSDLAAEEAALDGVVAALDGEAWATATAAAGWDVRDTIAHLATAEELAGLALTDPEAFTARLTALLSHLDAAEAAMTARGRERSGPDVLAWWRTERAAVLAALRAHDARDRVPWIAGPMSAASFATARLMETWAHGFDVADALGVVMEPTARLRHVADLGVRTRWFAYAAHGREMPRVDVRVELRAPDGSTWTWGADVGQAVRGDALDFCLVVTQRRHVDDTALTVTGDAAREWMSITQAFAGPPSTVARGRGMGA